MGSEQVVRLREDMTVNHVLHECPRTQRIFDQLLISASCEGHDCLDEVAWRRGIDCEHLLALLEEVIAAAPEVLIARDC